MVKLRAVTVAGALLAVCAAGCSLNPPLDLTRAAGSRRPVELTETPFHPQEAHHCGPASLLTVLEASGVEAAYADVVDRVYVPGLEGSLQVEMLAAARGYGRIAYTLPPDPQAVLAEIAAGRPVLMLLNLGLPKRPVWHYAVMIGFDPGRNRVLLHSGQVEGSSQRARPWLRRWDWAGRWAMVLLRPGEWPASPERGRLLKALAAFENSADPVAAGRAWQTAVEHWPDELIGWLGIGNAAHRRADWVAAVAAYQRALELDPDHLPARLNLALSEAEAARPCAGLEALGAAPLEDHPLSETFSRLEARLRNECRPEARSYREGNTIHNAHGATAEDEPPPTGAARPGHWRSRGRAHLAGPGASMKAPGSTATAPHEQARRPGRGSYCLCQSPVATKSSISCHSASRSQRIRIMSCLIPAWSWT